MATTKIWPVKGNVGHVLRYVQNAEKTEPSKQPDSLDSVLHYVGRGDKTDARQYVSALNCAPDTARMEMMAVKRHFDKTGGIVAFHGYQSFAPGEVTPEQAHQIGMQLISELWGDRFQVVLATHLDKEHHIHNHFVLNSVSFLDGKKFHSDAKFLHWLQETSDRLCWEHGLSVIEHPKRGGTRHHGEIAAEKKGVPTWRSLIQSDINQAIAASQTERQFFDTLKAMGYAYKVGQDISVLPPGKERFFRLQRNLGNSYSLPEIRKRLGRNLPQRQQPAVLSLPVRRHYRLKGKLPRRQKGHLRRLYYYYCYRLGVFKKHPQSTARMHFLLREDLRRLNNYTQEIRLLHTYHIDTAVQLSAFQEEKSQAISQLSAQRQKLRNQLRRCSEEETASRIKLEISGLSAEIAAARREVSVCENIKKHAEEMAEKIPKIQRDETEKRKEDRTYGHQWRGR